MLSRFGQGIVGRFHRLSGASKFVAGFSWLAAGKWLRPCVLALPAVDRACSRETRALDGSEPNRVSCCDRASRRRGQRAPDHSPGCIVSRCCPAASWLRVPRTEANPFFFKSRNGLVNPRGAATSKSFLACACVRAVGAVCHCWLVQQCVLRDTLAV